MAQLRQELILKELAEAQPRQESILKELLAAQSNQEATEPRPFQPHETAHLSDNSILKELMEVQSRQEMAQLRHELTQQELVDIQRRQQGIMSQIARKLGVRAASLPLQEP